MKHKSYPSSSWGTWAPSCIPTCTSRSSWQERACCWYFHASSSADSTDQYRRRREASQPETEVTQQHWKTRWSSPSMQKERGRRNYGLLGGDHCCSFDPGDSSGGLTANLARNPSSPKAAGFIPLFCPGFEDFFHMLATVQEPAGSGSKLQFRPVLNRSIRIKLNTKN